jgi:CheY-like chemotaxis protein
MAITVLVVDDELPVCELLRRLLEGWGYEVSVATDATQALEMMLANPPSILLVDVKMPGHDGFWLIDRVQAKWPKTAIIMATGAAEMDIVTKSKRAGVVDYVLKPFGRELLRQALRRAESARQQSGNNSD